MRILVHEFASGGGLAGQEVPASLGREGSAMLNALLADLAAIGKHQIVTTSDARFPLAVPPGVDVVTLSPQTDTRVRQLETLIASADAVWIVAPETDGCLENLAAMVERHGVSLLGSGADSIRRASDKAGLAQCLAASGVDCPRTEVFSTDSDWSVWRAGAERIGFPLVVKPRRGAGCQGVSLARDETQLRQVVDTARQAASPPALLLQQFVQGVAASVSLLADGQRAMALAVNAQSVRTSQSFDYDGGTTPLDHPLAAQAVEVAIRSSEALGGLCGYVGVDLVLTDVEAVVIEVNPRLTTAYLGVRSSIHDNVAELAIAACQGVLPGSVPTTRQHVRFTASGHIESSELQCR